MMWITKALFIMAFIGIINFVASFIISSILSFSSPYLPPTMAWFATKMGLYPAINQYLRILVFGWTVKQTIAFLRN